MIPAWPDAMHVDPLPAHLHWLPAGRVPAEKTKVTMKNALRSVGSILLSLIAAVALAAAIEVVSAVLHPWPADFAGTSEEIARQVETYPAGVLAVLGGIGWGGTMLLCTWLATRLGTNRHPAHGYLVGGILIAAVIFNISLLPYPTWYSILNGVLLPTALCVGVRLGKGRRRTEPSALQ